MNKKNFECKKCGECCRPIVLLTEEDIVRIKLLGLREEEFVAIDPIGEETHKVLKQKNNVCMFLKRYGENFICNIHQHRPEICRQYPFFEDIFLHTLSLYCN